MMMFIGVVVNIHSVIGFTSLRPSLSMASRNNRKQQLSLHPDMPSSLCIIHHTALKTRNITTAIQFYSLFGYHVACRFRAGPARAAWLECSAATARLELIEVPDYVLKEEPGTRARAIDLMQRPEILGHNHVALDVTQQIMKQNQNVSNLNEWLMQLNETSMERFQKSLRVALMPRQQIIGRGVYELAFLYDADGSLIELLHQQSELSREMDSGWEPWDGKGFVGG